MSDDLDINELKNKADSLGVKYSPNIGASTLLKRIEEKEAETDNTVVEKAPAKVAEPTSTLKEEDNRRLPINQQLRKEALLLKRVIITCMDPMYKGYTSQIFQVGNRVVGTIKKTIPFGVEFHVPQILLNQIESETFIQHSRVAGTEKSNGGMGEMERRELPRYAIRYLDNLTEKELEELKATLRAQRN